MRITHVEVQNKAFYLMKPYRIANQTIDAVTNCIVTVHLDNGMVGMGAAAPIHFVTGETIEKTHRALQPSNLSWLFSSSIYELNALTRTLQTRLGKTPAAQAALDMALYDAYGKATHLPVVDILGRVHTRLPTSITIGITDSDSTLAEAMQYIERGFKILKIKIGESVTQDIETLTLLKKHLPPHITLRVDINQGYSRDDFETFLKKTVDFNFDVIEQPFHRAHYPQDITFDQTIFQKMAADESLISVEDMYQQCLKKEHGIMNIKLMKCGGITNAVTIAKLAELSNHALMWGCMDESKISISAALHAAFSAKNTKYLDLDGNFELETDVVAGGFQLKDGYLETTDEPGLGVTLLKHEKICQTQ